MSALTSLLARDHAVPVRKIEEALSRQVVSGGDIGSVLLETEAIAENTLAAYQAALHGLLPATRDEVMRVARDAIRLVPREVAEKHRMVPLAVDGRALLVAMAAPLDHEVESQIGFLLGYELVVRIVCEVRVSAALSHHYGIEPPARQKRLIDQLRHRDAGTVPYVAPPENGKLSLSQRGLLSKKISASAWLDEPDDPEPPPPPPPPRVSSMPPAPAEGRSTDPMGVPRSQVEAFVGPLDAPPAAPPAAPEPAPTSPDAPTATLSDLALSDALGPSETPSELAERPPGARSTWEGPAPQLSITPAADAIDGRATSPYGPALPRESAPAPHGAEGPAPTGEVASTDVPGAANDATKPAASGERLSVAPIVGVGVRRSSPPPRASNRPPATEEARLASPPPAPIVEAVAPSADTAEPRRARPIAEPIAEPFAEPPSSPESSAGNQRAERRAPRLRGPLTAAQAAKLLEDASDRDGIVAVFFAFARQFFDYAALFSLQEDRAEGRDAFGEGATAARVRGLSLTVGGDEPSLLGSARKSGAPELGALTSAADADLAAVLERPRETLALAFPVVIRGRTVLVLYGDRGGDPFALSDLPELIGFVRRVADALERLILRRKREGRAKFEKPGGEERADLKAAAASAARKSRPPVASGATARQDVWNTPSPGSLLTAPPATTPSGPSLAEALAKARLPSTSEPLSGPLSLDGTPTGDELATRALEDLEKSGARDLDEPVPEAASTDRSTLVDPMPSGEVGLADEPATEGDAAMPSAEDAFRATREMARLDAADLSEPAAAPRHRTAKANQSTRAVLGIPRAAPPPPVVPDIFQTPGDTAHEVMIGATAMPSEEAAPTGPRTIPAPPPGTLDDSADPELVIAQASEREDSDPELVVGEVDAPNEPAPIELKRRSSSSGSHQQAPSYILRDASVDVVERPGRRSQPPGRRRSQPPVASEEVGASGSRRHDPRREDDDDPVIEIIATPQRGIGAMSKSAVIEPKELPDVRPSHDREVPSVIIDMGESTHALVEDLMHADPEGGTPAVDALLKVGEMALPALAQAFPGPLWFDRRGSYRKLPRGRDVSAVARALVAFRERAAPYVGALVGAGVPDRRFYAIMVASEIPSGALVDPLVQRAFDEDPGVRTLTLEVLPKFRAFSEVQDQLVFLRRTARIRGKEPPRRRYAISALVALRDGGALRTLVGLLEDEDAAVRDAAHAALVTLTCEDLGDSSRRWVAWADKNESRHRVEWLMDALLHADEALRVQAGEELKTLTQQYFGYHPSAPRKEREVAHAKYLEWWDREGKALFK